MGGRYVSRVWEHDPTLYAPASYRRACRYEAFVPDPLLGAAVTFSGAVMGVVSEAERSIAELNEASAPELAPLARLLLRTESIASSKVEGLQVNARTLARAEAAHGAGRGVGPQAAEVLANIAAMEHAVRRAAGTERIEPADLRDLHRVLLAGASSRLMPGLFRDVQNWIGGNDYNPCGADFVPPPPEDVERLIDDLCAFCNDDALPPVLQAAIAHAQLETIHPFVDGNGRTGRGLVQIILRRRGLSPTFVPPISVVLARDRERYIRGLTVYREDRLAEWVETFASATAAAAQLALRYRVRLARLREDWRDRLRAKSNPRADAAAWAIIDALPAHLIIDVAIAVAASGRTRPAVGNAINELEAAGVLIPASTSQRYRSWEAEGLLPLVMSLEAGED